jgi:hypothetical protein
MSAQHPQGASFAAAMPPSRKKKARRSTPIITILFWIVIIALATAGFIYGRAYWPKLFKKNEIAENSVHYASVTCEICHGRKKCVTCRGSGRAQRLSDTRDKKTLGDMKCRTCKGNRYCQACGGKGTVQQKLQ